MNKNYIKSLINTLFDENILKSEDDRDHIKALLYIEGLREELTGNFDEDLRYLKEVWRGEEEDFQPVEEDEPVNEIQSITQDIDEIVNSLKIGFNFVPGIGVGYCRNEEDLNRMRDFVRGGMAVQELVRTMFGI